MLSNNSRVVSTMDQERVHEARSFWVKDDCGCDVDVVIVSIISDLRDVTGVRAAASGLLYMRGIRET